MDDIYKLLTSGKPDKALQGLGKTLERASGSPDELALELTGDALRAYDQFAVGSVHKFFEGVRDNPPRGLGPGFVESVGPRVERTRRWVVALRDVRHERLMREARACVTLKKLEAASERGEALLADATSSKEAGMLARRFAVALAGLTRDREPAGQVIRSLMGTSALKQVRFNLMQVFEEAASTAAHGAFQESDQEWTMLRTQSVIELADACPSRSKLGEPEDEELETFIEEVGALLRAGSVRGRAEDFVDALEILVEFCPADQSSLSSIGGAEARMFLQLGNRAKLVAVRGLGRLGQSEALRKRVLALSNSPAGVGRLMTLAPMMGSLSQPVFFPYLRDALAAKRTLREEEAVVEAIGRIGLPEGVDLVLGLLVKTMKVSILDPPVIKRARMLLTSLGRIGRAKGLDPKRRRRIVDQVIHCVGERDTEISSFATQQMFSLRLKELSQEQRDWAARQLLKDMFTADRGTDLRLSKSSPLGFRAPIIVALTRLGKSGLLGVLKFASARTANYSGAFEAFAELMEKIGDPRAVAVLEAMARTSFMHESGRQVGAQAEKVGDAASGELRDLDPDDVISGLLYALNEIGGEEGARAVLAFADQVQAGQIETPGEKTSSILLKAKRESGTIGKIATTTSEAPRISEKDLGAAAAATKGGMFSKPAKRIGALAMLGRSADPRAIAPILGCLDDKDAMVASAAVTALIQFVDPLPSPEAFERFLDALFGDKSATKISVVLKLQELIRKNFPKRDPYRGIFMGRIGRHFGDTADAHRLISALTAEAGTRGRPETGSGAGATGPTGLPTTARLSNLEAKRQYLERRRAWIRSGKQGEAPKPPDSPPTQS